MSAYLHPDFYCPHCDAPINYTIEDGYLPDEEEIICEECEQKFYLTAEIGDITFTAEKQAFIKEKIK